VTELADRALTIRRNAVKIAQARGQGYVSQALGTAEILACLFFRELKLETDRFVLSPGHYALAVYSVMAELGEYDFDELRTYGMDGSRIEESPLEGLPGFEATAGSLAQGLSQAVGMALGLRLSGSAGRVFCLISDGELQEGQVWEAAQAAAHYKLDNLVVVLDLNERQVDGFTADVLGVEPVCEKFRAFGFAAIEVDGHDLRAICAGLDEFAAAPTPAILVCRTALGHGVPEFEEAEYPHYLRLEPEVWERALAALA
jgi:transketolase